MTTVSQLGAAIMLGTTPKPIRRLQKLGIFPVGPIPIEQVLAYKKMLDGVMSRRDVSKILGIALKTVHVYVQKGYLKESVAYGDSRITVADLEEFQKIYPDGPPRIVTDEKKEKQRQKVVEARRTKLEELKRVAKERGGEVVTTEYLGRHSKVRWRCADGHEWNAYVSNIINDQNWCRQCYLSKPRMRKQQPKVKKQQVIPQLRAALDFEDDGEFGLDELVELFDVG